MASLFGFRRKAMLVRIGAVAVLVLAAGFGVASIPDGSGVIHGCYKNSGGQTSIVESAADCQPSETAISWSQTGPQGPQGPQGLPGTPGSSFLAGSSGGQLSTGNHGSGCGGLIGVGSCAPLGSSGLVAQVVPVDGTLHNLHVHLSAAPGVGVHERWAVIVNGGGTFLGCDIEGTATSCSNTIVSIPLSAGDTVWLEAVETTLGGAAPAAVSWAVQAG